jgi:hypothetical protein
MLMLAVAVENKTIDLTNDDRDSDVLAVPKLTSTELLIDLSSTCDDSNDSSTSSIIKSRRINDNNNTNYSNVDNILESFDYGDTLFCLKVQSGGSVTFTKSDLPSMVLITAS